MAEPAMPVSATMATRAEAGGSADVGRPRRRPFRDNPRLIFAGIVILLLLLVTLLATANSSRFSFDFLGEFVLYGLSAADLTMLAALVFVLARNIVKLFVERRQALPFARFRAKLVVLLLGMTLVPAVLVLIVGSELIRTSVDRWFNAPTDEILSSANKIAADYYADRQSVLSDQAARIARSLAPADLAASDLRLIRDRLTPDVASQSVQMVDVYRVVSRSGSAKHLEPVVDVAAPALPPGYSRVAADRLAAQALEAASTAPGAPSPRPVTRSIETLGDGGVRELQPVARAETAADRRVSLVLPYDDVAHPCGRDVDGSLHREADHQTRAGAGRGGP